MRKLLLVLLLASVGVTAYIAGTKAGRSRYRQIAHTASAIWDDPEVRKLRSRVEKRVRKAARRLG